MAPTYDHLRTVSEQCSNLLTTPTASAAADEFWHVVRLEPVERLSVDRTTVVRLESGNLRALQRLMGALSVLGADVVVADRFARINEADVEPADQAPTDQARTGASEA